MAEENDKKGKDKGFVGLIFVGCLFLGMGIGFLTDNFVVWMFIGMGVGFLLMALVAAISKK